jgi:hypothetical protein
MRVGNLLRPSASARRPRRDRVAAHPGDLPVILGIFRVGATVPIFSGFGEDAVHRMIIKRRQGDLREQPLSPSVPPAVAYRDERR